jgi:undecaprenyl-phosphate galactose phosphotransferase
MKVFRNWGYTKVVLAAVDLLVLLAVASMILIARTKLFSYTVFVNELIFFTLSSVAAIVVFREVHLYKHKIFSAGSDQIIRVGKGIFWVGILQVLAVFLIKDPSTFAYSRIHVILFLLLGWFAVSFVRVGVFRPIHRRLYGARGIKRRVLAVGAGHVGQELAARIHENPELGLQVVGFVDDDPQKIGKQLLGKRIFGPIASVGYIAQKLGAQEIYVCINSLEYSRLLEIIDSCRRTLLPVTVTANHFQIIHDKIGTSEFSFIDSLTIRPRGLESMTWVTKRAIDILGSSLLLLLLSPAMIAIAIAIRLTSPGPVFYTSYVVGKRGELFKWFKFRTMVVNRDETIHREHLKKIIRENSSTEKIKNDPRITKVGHFLRRYSVDELPQLFNVLRGEMSLIGPRPCLKYEYEQFDEWHKQRFRVTPGMTGLWQVIGRNKNDVTFNDSIILDLYYIHNFSLWLDIKIILKTIPIVLFGRGGA